jgi:phosphoglycolate phosphatase
MNSKHTHNHTQAFFFDLDGTLIDTAPDLAAAMNTLLVSHNRKPISLEGFKPFISLGSRAFIDHYFQDILDPQTREAIRQDYIQHYQSTQNTQNPASTLFPGIQAVLDFLSQAPISWGIITNKSTVLTLPLLEKLNLLSACKVLVCSDTTGHAKPHPEPVYYACKQLNLLPSQTAFLGDSPTDILAGRHAGTLTLAAAYGYISPHDNIESWGADAIIRSPAALLGWLRGWITPLAG